jgi:hypothetical protein
MEERRSPWPTIGVFAYVTSLVLPAVSFESGSVPGIFCLVLGWLDFPPWSANIALLAAIVFRSRNKHRAALGFALLAVALGLTTLHELARGLHVGAGFFAWIGSMVALAIASSLAIIDREPIARARVLRT